MTRPPRVLLLCDRLNLAGGVERFVCTLANHLASEGLDVAVGSVDTRREAMHYALDAKVRVLVGDADDRPAHPVDPSPVAVRAEPVEAPQPAKPEPRNKLTRAWQMLQTQWRIARTLNRVIAQDRPDVIVLNGLTTTCSVLALSRRFAARTICCDHNHFTARSTLWQRLRRWLYPQVAAVVSLTEADAARFRTLNANTHVIYNAASLHADRPSLPDAPVVLAVGRHVAQKGIDLLLQAWADVSRAMPQAQLRVAGDGPLRPQHEAQAHALGLTNVHWIDPTPEVERLYREAAVFVLPSRYEGMPLALLEAQALGVPAVAFDCPTGPSEILTPDTGRLVPLGDASALARALLELLASPERRERMAHAAIERSRRVFSPQAHLAAWTNLIRQVAVQQAYATQEVRA
jgi:glycosyltransferase involved in cell wall biosynthesis